MIVNGIICVYKPAGYTSFDIIAIMRRLLNTKKIGHSGTLDPMAEGVLPTFVGAATKAVDFCPDCDKEYRAAFRLGLTTDTQDISGAVLSEQFVSISDKRFREVAAKYVGEIDQIPPMYSAVKVGGKKLYELARKGIKDEDIKRESRRVTIHSLIIESFDEEKQSGLLRVSCSKGTYIRTLIHDIGGELGGGAVMTALQRTRSNGFTLADCHSLESLRELYANTPEKLPDLLIPLCRLFDYPRAQLDAEQTQMFRNGVTLSADYVRFERVYDGTYSVYDVSGRIVALAKIEPDHSVAITQRFNYGD
ncbi:MAG: tRNA pseudouridine(55) synthase TruB [Oscillospiraceae bacterium]|nr:tRNA pseudouridine(55) synthase TruB [Oscillospiraceae bacterium]